MNRVVFALVAILCLLSVSSITGLIHLAKAESGTITINADGSISPSTAPIYTADNITYTLTGNISNVGGDGIDVERSNIVLDGAGYAVQAPRIFPFPLSYGIYLDAISNVTIRNVTTNLFYSGIFLNSSSSNSVSGNSMVSDNYGILLNYSNSNSISGNNLTNNEEGISFFSSDSNSLSGNNIAVNVGDGIEFDTSSDNSVNGNNVTNNGVGFYLGVCSNSTIISGNLFVNCGLFVSGSYGNVGTDNLVNGKPLVYLEDVSNYAVRDAGQVILVDCSNVTVENLNLSHTTVGVELSHTNNVVISGNNITANAAEGIWFDSSNNNIASGNNITNNGYGISLGSSSNNNVNGNNITNNIYGFYLTFASNRNTIYHNDLMNNTNQVTSFDSTNIWDDGYPSGGNYWSDYNGTDANHDGIGDTPYTIAANNTDNYPLMGTLYSFTIDAFPPWSNMPLTIINNSSVTNPFFLYGIPPFWSVEGPELPLLVFSVNGGSGAVCFCRLIMPKAFFLNSSTYIVFVDAQPINATVLTPTLNSTQAYLYFTYTNSTHQVIVTVPEFSSFLILPLFMIATLLAVMVYKKESRENKKSQTDTRENAITNLPSKTQKS